MIIENVRVYRAQAALLACTAIGALWSVMGGDGALLGLIIGVAGFVACERSWRRRESEPDVKTAEMFAAGGLLLALLGFVIAGLAEALMLLLLGAQLGVYAQLREHRQLKFGWMTSFAVLLAGAVHAAHDSYVLVFCAFAVCLVLGLGYAWLDRHALASTGAHWPLSSQLRVASTWLFFAFVLYLITPRLDALLLGTGGALGGDGYYDREWERQAKTIAGRGFADAADSGDGRQSSAGNDGAGRNESGANSGGSGDGTNSTGGRQGGVREANYAGFSNDEFDITDPDPAQQRISNVEVLSMRAEHGAYLRVRVFDTFDGVTWHNSRQGFDYWRGNYGEFRFDARGRQSGNFNQEIEVLASLPPAIPGASPAVSLLFPADVLRRTAYGTFEAPGDLRPKTIYTVESKLQFQHSRLLDEVSPAPHKSDLQLPDNLDQRVVALARGISNGAHDPVTTALALEQHLRTNYSYSLESVFTSQNKTPLGEFLFERRHGHCEYFASALAVMLRAVEIPARLATGYSATTYNPVTGRYEVRVLDGHAWVEAWVGNGWMLLEPTPFYPLPQPKPGSLTAEQIEQYLDRLSEIDEALGQTTSDLAPERLLLAMWRAAIESMNLLIAAIAWLLLIIWPVWLLLALVALAWIVLWRFRRDLLLDWICDWRIKRYRFQDDASDFHFIFRNAHDCAQRRQMTRQPGQSLDEYCTQLHNNGYLSHAHEELAVAARSFFETDTPWQSKWRSLLLGFYSDLRKGLNRAV